MNKSYNFVLRVHLVVSLRFVDIFINLKNDKHPILILHFVMTKIARKEALIRNVMAVDSIEHDEAEKIVTEMSKKNMQSMLYTYTPYKVGFFVSLAAGVVSFPMIFHLDTVQWFNEKYVTSELPPLEDLETPLEVASASWSWMEPICGQVSFVLLLLQFARNQALNLGVKPYGDYVVNRRAEKLIAAYPQYDEVFLRWFVEGQSLYGSRYLD